MKRPPIKVEFVLLCDDVRDETSGKHTLVGVHTGPLVLPKDKETITSPLSFFIGITLPPEKAVPVTTWIEGPEGERMQESDWGELEIGKGVTTNKGALVWKLFPWRSKGAGTYKLHMQQLGTDAVINEFELQRI